MSKSIKLSVTVLMIMLVAPFAVAQKQCSSSNITKNMTLDDSSKNESIKVEVAENAKCLMIGVNSTITAGSLTMEIFDPKGNKQGNFSVEGDLSSSSSSGAKSEDKVCGQLNKTFKEPMAGNWVIKLKPKKVTGQIGVHYHQMQEQDN